MKMLKNVIPFFLCFILSAFLIGCMKMDYDDPMQEEVKPTGAFIEVDRGMSWYTVYHQDSKVMYVVGGGTFTLLVNPDGTPMLWGE